MREQGDFEDVCLDEEESKNSINEILKRDIWKEAWFECKANIN